MSTLEHLREYQDYVLAYRLRALVGGERRPLQAYLSLADYAQKRLERQELAAAMVRQSAYHHDLRKVDALTDVLNFGFWHNPSETVDFLRHVIKQGGSAALENEAGFIDALLTRLERKQLSPQQEKLIASYYLGLLRASAAYLDAEVFTRLRAEVECFRDEVPIFVLDAQTSPASLEHDDQVENRFD